MCQYRSGELTWNIDTPNTRAANTRAKGPAALSLIVGIASSKGARYAAAHPERLPRTRSWWRACAECTKDVRVAGNPFAAGPRIDVKDSPWTRFTRRDSVTRAGIPGLIRGRPALPRHETAGSSYAPQLDRR